MTGWGGGYVTDITYMPGWYRQQSPAVLSLACLLGSVMTPMPQADDPVSYLELGCGQGYGALLLAASNPNWRVTAVDFNPAHIATARDWAAQAELANVTFIEADLATLAESDAARAIPEADFVSAHGLWSWVSPAVQAGVVRLLAAKVRPGGAVHVSYNSLPGWGGALGMQRLVLEAGRRAAARSDRQAEEGVKLVRALLDTRAVHLAASPLVRSLLSHVDSHPVSYLAHEYMNEQWAPCFMPDVAGALAGAKLEFVASAVLLENFPDLTLTDAQRDVVQRYDDPMMRELVKDHCMERQLRHDVYVRGARRIGNQARDAMLMDVHLSLNLRADDMPAKADMPAGEAELNQAFYRPIAQALEGGPRRVGDLLALPGLQGRRDNPAELIGILVGLGLAEPVLRPDAGPGPEALRFTRLATRRAVRSEPLGRAMGLASRRLGTGLHAPLCDLVVMGRVLEGNVDIDALMRDFGSQADDPAKLREALEHSLAVKMPILRAAGVF